ncbi:MAG: AMP-binding protein [Calditrichota bacterium]
MNSVQHFFEYSGTLSKDFILGREEKISYPEIISQVQHVARFLRANYGGQSNILLLGNNSVFFILAYLSILRSGNVCIPLNPNVSDKTLEYIIATCNPTLAFIQSAALDRLDAFDVDIISEQNINILPEVNHATSLPSTDSSQVAEIIFTSGSTALPKGVMLTHKNLIANTESIIEYLHLSQNDIMEVVLPFFYCYGLSLLHTHLRVGGSLVLNNKFIFVNTVIDDLQTYNCTGFAGVPSHFQILLRNSELFKKTQFPALKYVTQAGGKLADPFIREFVQFFPEVQFFVMYGQTEATARLSYLPSEKVLEKIGSIGRGIPGVELEVLDAKGRKILPGENGNIVATGDNIMAGYLNDPELTDQTIINGKLYTGDIATLDEDGYIFIVGREKEFIKVGGERVSPKEIEQVIVSIPDIVDCSVIGVEDDLLGEAIKVIVVPKNFNNTEKLRQQILSACLDQLGQIKAPKHVEFIDKIPMNSSGKKTKAALQQL